MSTPTASAGYATHLTSATTTATEVNNLPSLFHVLAQENLSSSLRSSYDHIIRVLGNAYPGKLEWLHKWKDEVYLVFDAIVQYVHLKSFAGSFAEHFYGLKRIKLDTKDTNVPIVISFITLVIIPYLKKKLDSLYDRLKYQTSTLDQPSSVFLEVYSIFLFINDLSNFLLQCSYCVGSAAVYNLCNKISGVQLVHSPPSITSPVEGESKGITRHTARIIGSGLSLGAFFIQFLDYYYSRQSDSSSNSYLARPTTVLSYKKRPPPPDPSLYSRVKSNRYNGYCLLCHEKRVMDTVLSTSGFVFCYTCIRSYVVKHKQCPATGIPSSLDNLIQLKVDN